VIDDLTMLANLPVVDAEADAQAEADKAAASETMPPAKRRATGTAGSEADRVERRGQDAPAAEKAGEEDS